jgi:hypothetical protein
MPYAAAMLPAWCCSCKRTLLPVAEQAPALLGERAASVQAGVLVHFLISFCKGRAGPLWFCKYGTGHQPTTYLFGPTLCPVRGASSSGCCHGLAQPNAGSANPQVRGDLFAYEIKSAREPESVKVGGLHQLSQLFSVGLPGSSHPVVEDSSQACRRINS